MQRFLLKHIVSEHLFYFFESVTYVLLHYSACINALIDHIEKILLELGKGFMYVVSPATTHYCVDMVFYNQRRKYYEICF